MLYYVLPASKKIPALISPGIPAVGSQVGSLAGTIMVKYRIEKKSTKCRSPEILIYSHLITNLYIASFSLAFTRRLFRCSILGQPQEKGRQCPSHNVDLVPHDCCHVPPRRYFPCSSHACRRKREHPIISLCFRHPSHSYKNYSLCVFSCHVVAFHSCLVYCGEREFVSE